ncbi:MAG: hypothetical protein JNG85_06045, partial [Spirochaetaceae bacterium]|nr:hypothetical protein [Spirochaetaceae bacterium]
LSCRARRRRRAGAILLAETALGAPSARDAALSLAARVAAEGLGILPWEEAGAGDFLARARWYAARLAERGARGGEGGEAATFEALSEAALRADAAAWLGPFVSGGPGPVLTGSALRRALEALLPYAARAALDREAPERVELPSGSSRPVLYAAGADPVVEARVQEFYGLAEHPRLCGRPLVLRLLSPAGRPLQVTADLPGFWRGSWAEARKELRGRYPKHDWPEDPAAAAPSAKGLKKKPPATGR